MNKIRESLIDEICTGNPAVVAAALQVAGPHRDALSAVLVARLVQAAVEPRRWDGVGGRPAPVFLLYLAAAWQLAEAHPLVVALLRLPPDDCEAVLDDFITEGAKRVLADTWPGRLDAIEALALDERAEPFARGAGLDAAALLFARGLIPRESVLSLLARCAAQRLEPEADGYSAFAGQIVFAAKNLNAWELRGTVISLVERGLIDPMLWDDEDELLEALEPGAAFRPDPYEFPPPITDAWETVRDWYFFAELKRDRSRQKVPLWETPAPSAAGASLANIAEQLARPEEQIAPVRMQPKVGRNDPCPCGSGRKFKRCCGA